MKKTLTLSIVIPVYNEEDHLKACLESIAAQSMRPDEVIVVDNNSSDNSRLIAQTFPFVKLLQENRQGLIPTRNTGFEAASGDIFARINADAVLASDWVYVVKQAFRDERIQGTTGPALTHTLPNMDQPLTTIFSQFYLLAAEAFFGVHIMWGANMAITRKAWHAIREASHPEDSFVHEDQDLSLLLARKGMRVKCLPAMRIYTAEESYFYWPKFKEYCLRAWQTRRYHVESGELQSNDALRLPWWARAWRTFTVPGYVLFAGLSFSSFYVSKYYERITGQGRLVRDRLIRLLSDN